MNDTDLAIRLEEMAEHRRQWEHDSERHKEQWEQDHKQRDRHWKVLVYVATLSLIATTALGIWGPR